MHSIRRALLGVIASLACALPASAQTAAVADQGPSLLWVWAWILIAGIAIFIVGTCLGARPGS